VKDAVAACHDAGIRVVMITGDHPKTAWSIASAVGLEAAGAEDVVVGADIKPAGEMSAEDRQRYRRASVFARVSPRQKLDLIDVHQQAGSIVAMTGDGVNDAPALKKADIGIAMGQRGTQVAQEAADMVLKDDAFATIVVAVEQGRIIFNNIRKFVLYLLSCNVSEVMIVFVASLINAPLPILPLQILFLNLVTDVFPALALGVGQGTGDIMQERPRAPDEPVLPPGLWWLIGGYGAVLSCSVLGACGIALELLHMSEGKAVTISFLTLAFCQLWHIFNMRSRRSHPLRNEIVQNPYVWCGLALCLGLLLLAVYVPVLANVMQLEDPGRGGWLLIVSASSITLLAGQIEKAIAGRFGDRS
jgi:Ca2+-transporting ATPase